MKLLEDSWIKYINLAHRTDRREHMERELARVGITAKRFEAIKTSDHPFTAAKVDVMMKRTPGAVGCHYSQVSVMAEAYALDKHAFILEDDVVFCEDFHERLAYIEKFLENKEWDVFFLGSTVHLDKPWWHHPGHNAELQQCTCTLGVDAEKTDDPRIIRVYGAFSTYAYLVNQSSLLKVMTMLDSVIHESMGIDWAFIRLSPLLKCFCFLPGSVKQYDNESSIGSGITYFSHFAQLGSYWFQNNMNDFDPTTWNNFNEITQ